MPHFGLRHLMRPNVRIGGQKLSSSIVRRKSVHLSESKTSIGHARTPGLRVYRVSALTRAERLEGDDGVGVLDAGKHLHSLVDEVPDVGVVVDVEFYQEIVVASGGIDLGRNLGFRKRIGDGVGLAELALDLDEGGTHRCRLRKSVSQALNIAFKNLLAITGRATA